LVAVQRYRECSEAISSRFWHLAAPKREFESSIWKRSHDLRCSFLSKVFAMCPGEGMDDIMRTRRKSPKVEIK
jgi:hypothetical protein